MNLLSTIKAMRDAGCSVDQIVQVVERMEGERAQAETARREREAARKRNARASKDSADVRGCPRPSEVSAESADVPSPPSFPLSSPPTPPPIIPQSSSPSTDLTEREREMNFRMAIANEFTKRNLMPPETGYAAVWLAHGFKPEICLAVIADRVERGKKTYALKYFDNAIADAHQKPQASRPASEFKSGYASPVVDMKAGAVAVVEGTDAYSAWLSRSPAVLKHKRREEKVGGVTRWVAYLPTEYPPGHVPKLSLSDRKEDAA